MESEQDVRTLLQHENEKIPDTTMNLLYHQSSRMYLSLLFCDSSSSLSLVIVARTVALQLLSFYY